MLNKTFFEHLNALKILNCCSHWPSPALKCVFGVGLKIENIPSTCFFALFPNWPNKSGCFLLKLILKCYYIHFLLDLNVYN